MLRAHPSPATPGYPVSLTCETQLPPQKSDVQLQFGFFRDGQCLVSGSENLLKISIPSITGSKDPPYYWCEAWTVTPSVHKESQKFQISLQSKCGQALRFAGKTPAEPPISPRLSCPSIKALPPLAPVLFLLPSPALPFPASCCFPQWPARLRSAALPKRHRLHGLQNRAVFSQSSGGDGSKIEASEESSSVLQAATFPLCPYPASFLWLLLLSEDSSH